MSSLSERLSSHFETTRDISVPPVTREIPHQSITMRLQSLGQCVIFCLAARNVIAMNIVAIASLGTTSHFIWTNALISELLARGHRVTEISVKDTQPHPNRTTFVLENAMCSTASINELIDSKNQRGNFLQEIHQFYKHMVADAQKNLNSMAFERLKAHLTLSDEKVDLILIDYSNRDALISISSSLGHPPIVAMTAFNHPATFNTIMGNPQSISLAPHDLAPFSCEMSLTERLLNIIGYAFQRTVEIFYFEPKVNRLLRESLGPESPSLTEFESNISVALVNTHPTTHCQRATMPSVVDVGFLHITPSKSLPKDIENFLDGAKDGAIVVSFGSVVRLDLMPKLQSEILAVFGKMKQRFLWKTASAPRNLPANVRAYKWLPQSDVLAHGNVRLLVAHGGTLSMQEAVYHGVPVILIPFYLDQHGNAARIANAGAGRAIMADNFTAKNLLHQINVVLENPKYKQTMQRLSLIGRDQPESPLERAVFWVEFVGRHRGAPHLRMDNRRMSWIQLHSIDAITMLSAALLPVAVLISVVQSLISRKTKIGFGMGKAKVA